MNYLKKILIIIQMSYIGLIYCQLPINADDPINAIIKRHSALGNIDLKYFNIGPNSIFNISNQIILKNNELYKLYFKNIQIPKIDTIKTESFLESKYNQLKNNVLNLDPNKNRDYFLNFSSDSINSWFSWSEYVSLIKNDNKTFTKYLDEFAFRGIIKNKIFVHSIFSMHRFKSEEEIIPAISYNNEWIEYFPEIKMHFWYTNFTSIYIKNNIFDIELANNPFSWGWSNGHSPILSLRAIPFNRLSLYKKIGNLKFEFLHGSLLPSSIDEIHIANKKTEKYIAGHRAQINLNKDFNFSFSELVIYGNRSPEISYLNPISFFWAQEHNIGDLDNVLLAFDYAWRIRPGCLLYNTLLIDELSWEEIFSDWWGNKYSFQIGIFLASSNLSFPDLRIEYTSTRPWTYTHPDFPYNHRGESLGSPYGPSSRSIRFESYYFPTNRIILNASINYIEKGDGFGSNIQHNYDLRNKNLDWDTKQFVGEIQNHVIGNFNANFIFSDLIKLGYNYNYLDKNEHEHVATIYINW